MVDYNNQSTVGTPAVDIVRVQVLERRANLFEAIEVYKKQKGQGIEASLSDVSARLFTLWLELEAQFSRKFKKDNQYEDLKKNIDSEKEEDIFEAITEINKYLDSVKLTMLDNKKVYDPTSVENENKLKGMG